MSEFLFYAIAILLVFWFVEQRPVAEVASIVQPALASEFIPALDVESFQPTPQSLQRQLEAIAAQNLYEQEWAEFNELLGFNDFPLVSVYDELMSSDHRVEQADAFVAQTAQDVQLLKDGAIAEFLDFQAAAATVDLNLPAPQIRALASLYGVPCSRKGRVSAATISALARVS